MIFVFVIYYFTIGRAGMAEVGPKIVRKIDQKLARNQKNWLGIFTTMLTQFHVFKVNCLLFSYSPSALAASAVHVHTASLSQLHSIRPIPGLRRGNLLFGHQRWLAKAIPSCHRRL